MTKADHIPEDFITNILSRLPSISLLRFKTVCKSWYSLISSPFFINLHYKQASQNPKVLLTTESMQFRLLNFENSSFDESCLTNHPLDITMETHSYNRNNHLRILGSSCGILCVAIGPITYNRNSPRIRYIGYGRDLRSHLFLINPFTRECRKIPDFTPVIQWDEFVDHGHGLGYNPISNDIKLVVSDSNYSTRKYNVFSVKSNSWKSVECPYALFRGDNEATVINGVFYWLKSSYPFPIIAFDSTDDKFLDVQIPKVPSSLFNSASLLEQKGCLCISLSVFVPPKVEIWMLKKHNWVHLINISSNALSQFGSFFEPILISSSTQVILHNMEYIIRYTKEGRRLDGFVTAIYESTTFVDTLVSPNQIQIIDN